MNYLFTKRNFKLYNFILLACITFSFMHACYVTTPWTIAHQFLCPWDFSGKNTEVGCHALIQGLFLTQGLKPCLLSLLRWQASSLPPVPHLFLHTFVGTRVCGGDTHSHDRNRNLTEMVWVPNFLRTIKST